MSEYGLFQDGECVEAGFYSRDEARAAILRRYIDETDMTIEVLCPDHPEHAADTCAECSAEAREGST